MRNIKGRVGDQRWLPSLMHADRVYGGGDWLLLWKEKNPLPYPWQALLWIQQKPCVAEKGQQNPQGTRKPHWKPEKQELPLSVGKRQDTDLGPISCANTIDSTYKWEKGRKLSYVIPATDTSESLAARERTLWSPTPKHKETVLRLRQRTPSPPTPDYKFFCWKKGKNATSASSEVQAHRVNWKPRMKHEH